MLSAGRSHQRSFSHQRRCTMNRQMIYRTVASAAIFVVVGLVFLQAADACTRVLWNDSGLNVVVGRTMDWPESTQPEIVVFPRGMKRDGGLLGTETAVKVNPAKWTSKYASMVVPVYGIGTADGFNEAGLAIHMLYLENTDFGPRDPSKPGVQAGLWGQYALDNGATVDQALPLLKKIQPVMVEMHGHKATVHLALEDATGDSAILEYINGKLVIHHGRQYRVMTNDPSYDQQLALLQKMKKEVDFTHPSSNTPLPGNVSATDRFQRASYFSALLPKPKDEREEVASILSIMRNVSVPFGAPYQSFGIYNTEYRTVTDLDTKRYYFELTTAPNVIWADLTKFDLKPRCTGNGAKSGQYRPEWECHG
ncbi:Acyl-coenzyme A:6-aminopenicillanic acid acyl-transferase subfamily [Nitrosococcus oceani AFC27]|nr:Acyl-coenzyme A:6-aminopenicillanic acid acyl-transferase subfamily [Nitrosococcus oceani AFC27]